MFITTTFDIEGHRITGTAVVLARA